MGPKRDVAKRMSCLSDKNAMSDGVPAVEAIIPCSLVLDQPDQEAMFSDNEDLAQATAVGEAELVNGFSQTTVLKPGTIVYVGHLPFGFFEQSLQSFFSQFGSIINLRLARNQKVRLNLHSLMADSNFLLRSI